MVPNRRYIDIKLDKSEKTTQGFLRVDGSFTRTGIFKYYRDGKLIRELRHPDDVFDSESIKSLQMAPLTDDHPKEMVTPDNVGKYAKGWISETVKVDGNRRLDGSVVVAANSLIDKVQTGKVELSCGYTAVLVEEQGIYDGEPYDVRQTKIRYNHVAVVDKGRAGPEARLRLDSANDQVVEDKDTNPIEEERKMKKIKIDGKDYEVSEEVADAFEKFEKAKNDAIDDLKKKQKTDSVDVQVKLDTATAENKELKTANEKLKAEVDTLKEKVEKKQDGLKPEDIDRAVDERARVKSVGEVVLGKEAKFDGKSNLEIMREVVAKHTGKDMKDQSDVYVGARFDGIADDMKNYEERKTQLAPKKADERKDADFDSAAAKAKSHQDAREEWKQDLSTTKK